MKKKFLSGLVSLLALATMASCGGGESSVTSSTTTTSSSVAETSSVASSDAGTSSASDAITAVSITNKDALKAEWHAGDQTRKIELSVTPTSNITALINQGKLTVTSSDATVVSASGLTLSAVGAGTATITVAAGTITDTVEITVAGTLTAIEKYQTVHAGTEEDPLDNEDAVKVAKAVGSDSSKATDKYFVQGVVKSFRDAPSSYGNVSFYFTAAEGKTEQFLAYRVKKGEAGADVTADDIWVGGTATVYCNFYAYKGNTYENSTGYLVSCTGDKPTIETHEVTASGAVAACKALDENSSSTDIYVVTGYVANNDGSSLYLVDNDLTETQTVDPATMFQVYNFKTVLTDAAEQAKCTVGAKVKVTCTIKYYKSSTSTSFAYETSTISEIVVLEAGETEKAATEATVAEALTACNALADNGKSTDKYAVTGYIIEVTTAYSTKFKNISLTIADSVTETDATKMLSIYRGELADGVEADKLVAGAQIKVTGILNKYVKNDTTSLQMAAGGEIALLKEKEVVAPTAIALPETATTRMGETLTLTLTLTPSNATLTGDVTWDSSEKGVATVTNGVVTPVSAGTTVITATYGDFTATCTVTVAAALNYGTLEAPLSIADALTLAADVTANTNDFTPNEVYVKGDVKTAEGFFINGDYFGKYNVSDGTNNLYVVNSKPVADVKGKVFGNDEVVVKGYIQKTADSYQFIKKDNNTYPSIEKITKTGTSAITVGDHENATVTVTDGLTSGLNGSTFTFSVAATEGYTVSKVTVSNGVTTDTVTADAGTGLYSGVVKGDMVITVTTEASTPIDTNTVTHEVTVDDFPSYFTGTATDTAVQTFTANGIDYGACGFKTKSSATATSGYAYIMLMGGTIYNTSVLENYYVSNVTLTFTSGTGTSGSILTTFGTSTLSSRVTAGTGVTPTKGGTYSVDNTDSTKQYFNISNLKDKNTQIESISITWSKVVLS